MSEQDIALIRRALEAQSRHVDAVIEASYGAGLDARDTLYHTMRSEASEALAAMAALGRVQDILNGYPATPTAEPDGCSCHLMRGETCGFCNEAAEQS